MKFLEAKRRRRQPQQKEAGKPAAQIETETEDAPVIDATDAAQRLATEHGIDLATVTGTGTGGRITQPDVQALIG